MAESWGSLLQLAAAIWYWFAASLIAWGALSPIGLYWHPLHASAAVTILLALAIGCFANWVRNRTFHCALTGPLTRITPVSDSRNLAPAIANNNAVVSAAVLIRNWCRVCAGIAVCDWVVGCGW